MAKSNKNKSQKKMTYFLDHPQIKRNKSWGNGMVPTGGAMLGTAQAGGNKKGSLAEMINFGGNNPKK